MRWACSAGCCSRSRAAAVGEFVAASASEFYGELVRPSWAPPGWLSGPVWSALYALMGVSDWLVWQATNFAGARGALGLFVVQLAINALWTWLFFVWRTSGCGVWRDPTSVAAHRFKHRPVRAGQQIRRIASRALRRLDLVCVCAHVCLVRLNPGLLG
ncbi:MAG: TspO/MBR family protein [Nitrobacter sp.]